MSRKMFKFNIFTSCCLVALGLNYQPAVAYSYIQSPYENIDYYELGMNSMENREFTKAIEYLKRALEKEPQNPFIRNNLAVALTSRGTYLYNQKIDLEKAANDYRSAIYYLEYYTASKNTETMKENIFIAHQNLNSVLKSQNAKTDGNSRLKKAKELRGEGELTTALVEYIYASKERPYAYESYIAIGDIFNVLSDNYNAALYYDKALAINSKEAYLHLKFGRTLLQLGKIDTAVRELEMASQDAKTKREALTLLENIWTKQANKNPKDAIIQMNLGAIYQKQGKLQQALSKYSYAEKLDPKNPIIRLNMATLFQEQGNYAEALEIYNSALKNNPENITVKSYKAATLNKLGKTDEAIAIYKSILASNPENLKIKMAMLETINSNANAIALNHLKILSKEMPNDAEIQYNYGYLLHKNKQYSEALPYYKKSLELNSQNLDAYLNIARIYKQQNNLEMALETINKAKIVFPKNSQISEAEKEYNEDQAFLLAQKATKLYEAKDYENAIITYKSIKNPSEDILLGIGACYQAMENYNTAITFYNKAIEMDNSNPTSYYFLGLAHLYNKEFQKAETALKRALELDNVNPDIADAYKTLKFTQSEHIMNEGINFFEQDKLQEALQNFNKAISICENNGYAYYYRGLVYDALTQVDKAIFDYKKALELVPELTMTYYSMGVAYDNQNNKSEAKKMYQQFLNTNKSDNEYTKYAKQRLMEL